MRFAPNEREQRVGQSSLQRKHAGGAVTGEAKRKENEKRFPFPFIVENYKMETFFLRIHFDCRALLLAVLYSLPKSVKGSQRFPEEDSSPFYGLSQSRTAEVRSQTAI